MQDTKTILPTFLYHPDPVSTGSIRASGHVCACCEQSRGFIYPASVSGRLKPEDRLCPWCIANGEAALKFNCVFSDEQPLVRAGVPRAIILEVTRKTPGYNSWQQQV